MPGLLIAGNGRAHARSAGLARPPHVLTARTRITAILTADRLAAVAHAESRA